MKHPQNWKPKKLDELGFVGRGKSRHRPRNAPELYGGEHPFVQTANIMASDLYINSYSQTYNELGLAQSKLWEKGTLCITIAGENTAETAILGFDACFPDSIIGFISDPELSDVRFVKYYLDTIKPNIKAVTKGATQDNLSLDKLLSFDLLVPDVSVQRRIADILASYDDLIENNRRRIDLLEQSARMLYKEWFVSLRFPGHEHVKVKDGVPQGWQKRQVREVIETVDRNKKIQKSDYLPTGLIPCIDQSKDFIGGYTDDIEALINEEKPVIVFGDHTRVFKFVNFPFASGADGTQLINSKDDAVTQEYLFFALEATDLSNYFYARHFKFLKAQLIFIPTQGLIERFTELIHPLMLQIKTVREASIKLRQARDLLLPRLMNGEIAV